MPSILDPKGQAELPRSASTSRAVATVQAPLFEQYSNEQLQAATNGAVVAAFLNNVVDGATSLLHQQVTVPVRHPSLGPQYFRICSCGCFSGPFRHATSADLQLCEVQVAEGMRAANRKNVHAKRVVQALLGLGVGA